MTETLRRTGHPRKPGMTALVKCSRANGKYRSKHVRARGRTALSGVDLRPQGPVGGSKRKIFPAEPAALNPPGRKKSRKVAPPRSFREIRAVHIPLRRQGNLSRIEAEANFPPPEPRGSGT